MVVHYSGMHLSFNDDVSFLVTRRFYHIVAVFWGRLIHVGVLRGRCSNIDRPVVENRRTAAAAPKKLSDADNGVCKTFVDFRGPRCEDGVGGRVRCQWPPPRRRGTNGD